MAEPYHKYVFDAPNRKFVGDFESMYKNEDVDQYDSWYQEDMTDLNKHMSLAILDKYSFGSVLDIGCGKGVFTHLLKKANNTVTGIDVSETAISKAQARFPTIEFRTKDVSQISAMSEERYDLVVVMEILSYIEQWRELLETISKISKFCYISLFIPPNPIGFVKSAKDLSDEVSKLFNIEVDVVLNKDHALILARSKAQNQ